MRFWNAMLASVLILLAALVTAATSTQTSFRGAVSDARRRLDDPEERGVMSSIKGSIKGNYLASTTSTEFSVKKSLNLVGMRENSIKIHPNHKTWKTFLQRREGDTMDDWVRKKKSPGDYWYELKLNTMTAAQREKSDELKKYVRYATKYDKAIWQAKKLKRFGAYQPYINYGGSPEEMSIKVQIWAKAKRSDKYVAKMLELNQGRQSANYKYFLEFQRLRHPGKYARGVYD